MALPEIFTKEISDEIVGRIHKLNNHSRPLWGKMSVAQMLAHCCVPYEYVYEHKHKSPGMFMKLFFKFFVKDKVVSEKPYPKNSPTAPDFVIKKEKNFEEEKARLIRYIQQTQELGKEYFNDRISFSFGKLSITEWNNMFYKHLDHHLTQFGV